MDATNIMANPQTVNDKAFVKQSEKVTDKNATQNSNTGKQDKDFDDVLNHIVQQPEKNDEAVEDENQQPLSLMHFANPVTLVEIISLPNQTVNSNNIGNTHVLSLDHERVGYAALAENIGEDILPIVKDNASLLSSEINNKMKLADFTDQMKNQLTEAGKTTVEQAKMPIITQPDGKSTSQDLLNMLTGKTSGNRWQQVNAANALVQTEKTPQPAMANALVQTEKTPQPAMANALVQTEKTPQAVMANALVQTEKTPQQSLIHTDVLQEGQETVSVLKGDKMDGQMGSAKDNTSSFGQDAKTALPDIPLTEAAKKTKVTMADLLKENHLDTASDANAVKAVSSVMPEESIKMPEQMKVNTPDFAVNAVDNRVLTSQQATMKTPENVPESMAKYNIPDQIIEQAKLIKTNEDTQMIIKLRPEHLGDLTLKVTVEHGVVNASFHSDNANVRSMIESSLLQLRQELAAQGIKVDNVSVYAGLGEFLSNGQNQAQSDQRGSQSKNKKIDLDDFNEDAEKIKSTGLENASNDGVDYRI